MQYFLLINLVTTCVLLWGCDRVLAVNDAGSTDADTDADTDSDTDSSTDPICASIPNWTKHTVDDMFANAQSVYAADVDGDGDMDVLGAAAGESTISWWESDCIP